MRKSTKSNFETWWIFNGEMVILGLVVALIILGSAMLFTVSTYMEMNTFNKFSKTKATFWDAVCVRLVVIPEK